MLVFVDGSWYRVRETRNIEGEEYLLASFDWWKVDQWVSKEKVENTMIDTGQFD